MISFQSTIVISVLMSIFVTTHAFAPQSLLTQARPSLLLKMGNENSEVERLKAQAQKLREEAAELAGTTVEEIEEKTTSATKDTSGTFYDDEVEPYKDPLSDSMRSRLMAEASTGLDSNQKQTNVILYISVAVTLLVLAGGQGILY
mmetsp:Transcript_19437/g.27355  ORF Transcript_19437/g.27355 Transcript_19437/m.27355 type:complete len:146 (+) Transcript_19437:43-480(+)